MNLLYIALATASVSFTITITSVFKGFREWLSRKHPKLEELIHCPWCMGHYVGLFFMVVTGNFPVATSEIVDFVVGYFAIIAITGIVHYILLRAYEPVSKLMVHRKLDKLDKLKKHE